VKGGSDSAGSQFCKNDPSHPGYFCHEKGGDPFGTYLLVVPFSHGRTV
jgi:hypothetical protein